MSCCCEGFIELGSNKFVLLHVIFVCHHILYLFMFLSFILPRTMRVILQQEVFMMIFFDLKKTLSHNQCAVFMMIFFDLKKTLSHNQCANKNISGQNLASLAIVAKFQIFNVSRTSLLFDVS